MIGFESEKGWYLLRMLDQEIEDGAQRGKGWIEANPERAARAVLIYDAYRTIAGLKTDALVSILIEYEPVRRHLEIVLPYRHAEAEGGFAVHRPKFRDRGESDGAAADLTEAFFRGGDLHAQGAAIWHSCLDESR